MSQVEVNKVIPQSGTDLQLGESGDTITIPSGATLDASNATTTLPSTVVTTTGSQTLTNKTIDASQLVDASVSNAKLANSSITLNGNAVSLGGSATVGIAWQSVQTTGFTASAGNAYPCNTTSAGFTVTLPATPSAGDQVQLVDYAGTFDTNALEIDPNGENLEGGASNLALTGEREGATLTYIDSTQGWIATSGINEGTNALDPLPLVVNFLVIAGGGGGGGNDLNSSNPEGGGGGAGGYRSSITGEPSGGGASAESAILPTLATNYTVTIGGGGTGSDNTSTAGGSGSNSVFSTITSTGGGGGGARYATATSGGSGGGGAPYSDVSGTGGTGTANQGFDGGDGSVAGQSGGGGGGAGGLGANADIGYGGDGGIGISSSITGSSIGRAGGGAGANGTATDGGGDGGINSGANAVSGTANTGGGGGGQGRNNSAGAGSGGSGVVILKYPDAYTISNPGGGLTFSTSTAGGFSVTSFTAGTGNVQWN